MGCLHSSKEEPIPNELSSSSASVRPWADVKFDSSGDIKQKHADKLILPEMSTRGISQKIQRQSMGAFPNQLGPFETPITNFTDESFHFLDKHLNSDNPFFIMYRESFAVHQFLPKIIWNFPLIGQTSPKHKLTLNDTAREAANIPSEAKWYVWSYPIDVEWRATDFTGERDLLKLLKKQLLLHNPDFLFLLLGGFVYFDDKFRVVGVNAIRMPRNDQAKRRVLWTAKGLNFAHPLAFRAKYIDYLMRNDRLKVAPGVVNNKSATHFAWLPPCEEIVAADNTTMKAGPHGAFVYLFSKLISRDPQECSRNVYFNLLCHNVSCCQNASLLPFNIARRVLPQDESDRRFTANTLLRSDRGTGGRVHSPPKNMSLITLRHQNRLLEAPETALVKKGEGKLESSTESKADISLAVRGVSIEILKQLAEEFNLIKNDPIDPKDFGGRKPSYGEIFVNKVIKPKTKDVELSYAEWIMEKDPKNTFKCNVYVSHSWECDFSETVKALEKFEQDRTSDMKLFYFCDLISINHWLARGTSEINELRKLIGDVREMVLVLSPWDKPKFFSRTWFIFEISQAIQYKTRLSIYLPPKEYKPLEAQIKKDFRTILNAIDNIDSKTATARENSTMHYIQYIIQEDMGGFAECTKIVGLRMKRWLIFHILQIDEYWPGNQPIDHKFLLSAAEFLEGKSEFDQRRALRMLDKMKGPTITDESLKKATALSARILCNLEELERSERISKELLEAIWRSRCDDGQVDIKYRSMVIKLVDLLAEIKNKLGMFKKAFEMQHRVVAMATKWFGEDNEFVFRSKENLGTMLMERKRFESATTIFRECLIRSENWVSTESDQVRMAVTRSRLAKCLFSQRKLIEAKILLQEALIILEATTICKQEDLNEALYLYREINSRGKLSQETEAKRLENSNSMCTTPNDDYKIDADYGKLEDITSFFSSGQEMPMAFNSQLLITRSASTQVGFNADDIMKQKRTWFSTLPLNRQKTNNSRRDTVQLHFSKILLCQLRELSTPEAPTLVRLFLGSLPTHILACLPRNEEVKSSLSRASGILFRRTCSEQSVTIVAEFDRQYLNALEACFSSDLKEKEGIDNKQIELMTKELRHNFHFSVKPNAQIKAELVCQTREMFWLSRGNKALHQTIRQHISKIDKEINMECDKIDIITKLILSWMKQKLPIPYFETTHTTKFEKDDLVLDNTKLERDGPPRPARIKEIKGNDVILEYIVDKQKSAKKRVDIKHIRRAFTWQCWRCQNEPKPHLWRDVYPEMKWISCLECGLVTEKLGMPDQRYLKRHVIVNALYGVVYFGFDSHFGRDIAIKECDRDAMAKKERLENGRKINEDVEMEIEIHSELSHPGIIQLWGTYISDNEKKLNVVLEYADGGDLFDHVKKHFQDENSRHDLRIITEWQLEVQSMFYILFSALKEIHCREIVHRDLSLENCLLSSNRQSSMSLLKVIPRICDFGLAKRLGDGSQYFYQRVGKRGYWSPECYKGKYLGKANDVWCLGIMLFTMLVGGKPYQTVGDIRFQTLMNDGIVALLESYRATYLVPHAAMSVLAEIFVKERHRLSTEKILEKPWFKDVGEKITKQFF